MIFQNNQILDEWHDHWKSKENALRSRLIKNCERLEANTKNLDPLREGDVVLVQNQIPNSPRSKKWDRQGTVVFTGENDQYLIKVAGTGRLTLRNRQFLRKFQPGPSKIVDTKSSMLRQCSPVAGNVAKPDDNVTVLNPLPQSPMVQEKPLDQPYQPAFPEDFSATPQKVKEVEAMVSDPPDTPASIGSPTVLAPREESVPVRRSTRARQQTQFYDANIGK